VPVVSVAVLLSSLPQPDQTTPPAKIASATRITLSFLALGLLCSASFIYLS
jgi:hypothetical protein